MSEYIDLDNPRYQPTKTRPFGELCTRMRFENGETIDGIACCWGLNNEQTDDWMQKCKECKHLQAGFERSRRVCNAVAKVMRKELTK